MKSLMTIGTLACSIFVYGNNTQPVTSAKDAAWLLSDLLIYTTSDMRLLPLRAEFNSEIKLREIKGIASRFNAAAERCKQSIDNTISTNIEQNVAQCLTKEALTSKELMCISEAVRIEDSGLDMSRRARYFLHRVAEHAAVIEKEQQKQEKLKIDRQALERAHRQAYHSFQTV